MGYHLILRPEVVAIILYKKGICDLGKNTCLKWRECSRSCQVHMRRGWSRWEGIIQAECHLILRPEVAAVSCIKRRICDFGQKYTSQMAKVFSELASPHDARVVSLGRQNISGVPFNIKDRSCRRCPVQKSNL